MGRYKELVWTPEMVRNFWDWQSQYPEEYFTYRLGGVVARTLQPYLPEDASVLDYGCGVGFLTGELLGCSLRVAGLDSSPQSRAEVTQRFESRDGFLGAFSQEELMAKGLHFDAITVVEVVEHLYDQPLDSLFSLLGKLLKPGGLVMITTPNEEKREEAFVLCPVSNEVFHRYQHVRSWSRKSLSAYLTERGFQMVRCEATNFNKLGRSAQQGALRNWIKRALPSKPGTEEPPPHLLAIARRA